MKKLQLLILSLLLITSCELPDRGVIEPSTPPYISQADISLKTLDVNKVTAIWTPTDPIDTLIQVTASIQDNDGLSEIQKLAVTITNPDGLVLINDQALLDNGISPDGAAGDGNYAGHVRLQIQKKDLGTYCFEIKGIDKAGNRSNAVTNLLIVRNYSNRPPRLLGLIMQDTVFVPSGTTVDTLKMYLTAADSEGLSDISSVLTTLYRENGDIVKSYSLFDDGGSVVRELFDYIYMTSGDRTANDGIFSLQLPIPSNTFRNVYRDFVFRATDRSGEISNTITKRVYFK